MALLDIADLIRELRRRQGLTQEQFAARLGVTCPTVNRWENRRAKPSPVALKLIRALLNEIGEPVQDLAIKFSQNS